MGASPCLAFKIFRVNYLQPTAPTPATSVGISQANAERQATSISA
ncbi:hypothetical protein AM1_D0024 (plasmid) [Acaryochloris marina MBIC11017]|uniref:Uncharacterized protein n=1 Tax=Acaryochloris marina (strain MBIC 11017) TaxID=329726 RepID=A8ZND5_ACAM1|nr:hypothetical protein AM1_D0024 [Acaryochloris marina MBIC11017]